MLADFRSLCLDENGGTLVEYAIIAASFGILMITALTGIQNRTGSQFTATSTGINVFEISPP